MKKIRTRYAPSPTGFLHIGGARTALFNYIFAKKMNGKFILRIEDTDLERNIADGERSQIENLEWLGIIPDESPIKPNKKYAPYRQSEKLDKYKKIIQELILKGFAYKAYETTNELAQQKEEQEALGISSFRYDPKWLKISDVEKAKRDDKNEFVIRMKVPKDITYKWNDLVRGKIEVPSKDVGDWIIQKQNGYPTYNFAVVIDDHDMEISHVLRGEEHITNTPKQIGVYQALKWAEPKFGHLTIITNMDGKKLSKRDTSIKQFIEDYKNEKYHNHAIFNFLSLLGWSHPNAKEILLQDELINSFEIERLSKSPSKFDIKKMNWFSKEYIKNLTTNKINKKINIKFVNKENQIWKDLFIDTYKQNATTFKDIENAYNIYKKKLINEKLINELKDNIVIKTFTQYILQTLNNLSVIKIQDCINKTKEKTQINGKNLFHPIREVYTGQSNGPELAKAIYLMGFKKIKNIIEKINK